MNDILFRLRPLKGVSVVVFDGGCDNRGAVKYRAEVKVDGKVLFPATGEGAVLWGAFSPMHGCDGDDAKRCVLHHLALRPGDTDDEFFKGYTADQLDFVQSNGEEIYMAALHRYGED